MANIQTIIHCELDPNQPVKEICAVISALLPYHAGQEEAILRGVTEAIGRSREQLKGDGTSDKSVL